MDKIFKLLTDHQALLSALNENRGNKTYQSRLTRWVDRFLPFNFTIEHVPGKDMGFADYLGRNPSQPPPPPSTDDTQFIINTINDFKYILLNDTIEKLSADKHQTQNDVISNKEHARQKTNIFAKIVTIISRLPLLQIYHSLTQLIQYIQSPILIQFTNHLPNLFKICLKHIILLIKINSLQIMIPPLIPYILYIIPQIQNPPSNSQRYSSKLSKSTGYN